MATVDDLTFTLSADGTYYTVKATSTAISGALEIPAEYSGLPVKAIAMAGFNNCSALTSVVVPESITAIPQDGFRLCSKLTSISLPAGLTSIGTHAFNSCTSLTSITIPAKVSSIGTYAFFNCTSLTSIELPAGLTSIGGWAFQDCTSLTSFKFEGDAVAEATSVLESTSKLTAVHVNAFSTGYGTTWGGKTVVVDNPVYLGGERIKKAYLGETRVRKWHLGAAE